MDVVPLWRNAVTRIFSLVACALLSFGILTSTSPAFAGHEGPYVVGEQKDFSRVRIYTCRNETSARASLAELKKISETNLKIPAIIKELLNRQECGLMSGTAFVVGQIGEDEVDETGRSWRIVHIKADEGENTGKKDFYVVTYGAGVVTERR